MHAPKKSYGQHFLHEHSVIEKIIEAAELTPDVLVIEAGPGRGALTEKIYAQTKNLVLIEADADLVPELEGRYPEAKIIQADAAAVNYDEITAGRPWIFVSNLPYNAGNAIVMQVLMAKAPPKHLVIMVQKEVGERMLGVKGSESVLSVATAIYAHVSKVVKVLPGAFTPPPKVDSVVLKLIPYISEIDREKVISIAKVGFHNRRKQLHKNLSEEGLASSEGIKEILSGFGLSPLARAEELSLQNWIELSDRI
jgi:16S rRNA (adenine1518-N6/adenine1519-N6)-dimethyltransferase